MEKVSVGEPEKPASYGASGKMVAEVMTWPVVAVPPGLPVREAERLARVCNVRHLVVTEGEIVIGALCVCDLWWTTDDTLVFDRMSTPVVTVTPSATLEQAAWQMLYNDVGCLPVVRGRSLTGVLTRNDLIRAGVLDPSPDRQCLCCGATHHLRALLGGPRRLLCVRCLAERTADELEPFLRRSRPVVEIDPIDETPPTAA